MTELGTLSQDIGRILGDTTKDWGNVSPVVAPGSLGKAIASTKWWGGGWMFELPWEMVQKKAERMLREVGLQKWMHYGRSEGLSEMLCGGARTQLSPRP